MLSLNNIGNYKKLYKTTSKRVGRGGGSGKGKTCGKGHKGQKSRSGKLFGKKFFEGGQTPYHRRLPKFGFSSRKALYFKEIRIDILNNIEHININIDILKNKGIISNNIKYVKIIGSGNLMKKINLIGLNVTKKVKHMIENVGGTVK